MSRPASERLQFGIDRLVVSGARIFGWGWIADPKRAIHEVHVHLHGPGWRKRLGAMFGIVREDVAAAFPGYVAARQSGFVVTGYLPGPAVEGVALEATFEDGTRETFDLGNIAEVREAARAWRHTPARLARSAWRRLKARDFSGLLGRNEGATLPSADGAEGRKALANALQGTQAVRIIFDHDMGGGANHFRRGIIARWQEAGEAALLCTYNLGTLDYRFRVHVAGRPDREFRASNFLALEPILQDAPVGELFVNSPVAFDQPALFADWLARMRERHPRMRLTVTVHDYLAICPSFVLLDADGAFCGVPDIATCEKCLERHGAAHVAFSPPTRMAPWREAWGRCLRAADEVRCFSESSRALLVKAYPSLARDSVNVVPHRLEFSPRRPGVRHRDPITIGIVGQINLQKGAGIVADLMRQLERRRVDARVVIIGALEIPLRSSRLEVTGPYKREDLPGLVESHGINMMLFPSIWPETFSYVVAEMMAMQLPIVAFDLGAPAERLRGYPLARLVAKVDADAALDAMLAFHRSLAAEAEAA
jgi:glycosyltransferase involved in cell wall biosynthesis